MGLITNIKRFLGRDQEQVFYGFGGQEQPPMLPTFSSLEAEMKGWGKAHTYTTHDSVYSIVSMLVQKLSSIPWVPYEIKDKKKFAQYKSINPKSLLTSSAMERHLILRSQAVEVAADSDLAKLLETPNKFQSFTDLITAYYGYKCLYGEGNLYLNAGAVGGRPVEMNVIPPPMLGIIGDKENIFGIEGYYIVQDGQVIKKLNEEDIIAWKYFNPYVDSKTKLHLRGLSPLASAGNVLEQSFNAKKSLVSMFKNGGSRGTLFGKNLPRTLTKPQIDKMIQDVNERINHNTNKGSIAALQGEWGYHNFGMSAVDMQLINAERISLQRLCNVYNVPTVLFDAENTTYNNYESAIKQLVVNKLIPELVSLRDLFNRKLVSRFKQNDRLYMDFDITEMPEIQKDLKDLNESVREAHWLSYNERRAVMRYSARPEKECDFILLPQGYYPIQELSALMDSFGGNEPNNGDV